jgi:RNA polymerase sigma-70 factor (ECF subfamily)
VVEPQAQFEQLYREYADRVHAYALRRTSPAAADDVVAEVFLVVWRRLDRVPEQPLPWLYGVARRVVANRRRGESRAAALHERLVDGRSPVEPSASVTSAAVEDRVQRALAGLSERDRELLLLIAWEGLRVNEAAAALGVRSGTLAVRLHRARQRLAQALAEEDVEIEMEVRT